MAKIKKPKSGLHGSPMQIARKRYMRSKMGVLGLAIVLAFILVGALAPAIANNKPLLCKYKGEIYAPALIEIITNFPLMENVIRQSTPFDQVSFNFKADFKSTKHEGDWAMMPIIPYGFREQVSNAVLKKPSRRHWIGTDGLGRDLASRMVYGARISMLVGFVSVGISTILGLILGALAGFYGGRTDMLISRVIEIVTCFPVFMLILCILAIVQKPSIWIVMCVIGGVRWTGTARYVRGEFIRLRDSEFALAAVSLGAGHYRIITKHLLPNSLAPLFVSVSFSIAAAIAVEASLSFLGFGVQPPTPSWGSLLSDGYANIRSASYMIFPPCIAIFLAILSYNLVGDSLRDAVDPRTNKT